MKLIHYMIFCLIASISIYAGPRPMKKTVAISAADVSPLLIGQQVPNSTLKTLNNKNVKLHDLLSKKPTILVFYRGGWCPFCKFHLKELAQNQEQLIKLGYQIIAISPDLPKYLKESSRKHELSYTILSDSNMDTALAFGLAFKVDDKTLAKYKTYKIDLDKASGKSHHLLPVPAVFVVNTDAEIMFEYVNPNYKVRLDGSVMLAAALAYRK